LLGTHFDIKIGRPVDDGFKGGHALVGAIVQVISLHKNA
jgi:hypothetical protein